MVYKKITALIAAFSLLLCMGIIVSAEDSVFPVAQWDMASAQLSQTGGNPTCYHIDDTTQNGNYLRAYYGSTFENGYVTNPAYSQQKYAYMPSGPYLIKQYDDENEKYINPEGLLSVIDGEHTFETWVKFTSSSNTSALYAVLASGDKYFDTALSIEKTGSNMKFIFRRMFASGQHYFTFSETAPLNEWVHIVLTYEATASGKAVLYINGEKTVGVDSFKNASGLPKAHTETTTELVLARNRNNGSILNLNSTYFGKTAFYDGVMTEEKVISIYDDEKERYRNGYVINFENNNSAVLDNITEGELEISFDVSAIDASDLSETSVKITGENGDVAFERTLENNVYTLKKDFINIGKYNLIIDKSINDLNETAYRTEDFVYPFEVFENPSYREGVVSEIKDIFLDEMLSDENVMNKIINDYNYILMLDISEGSDYSKIINKVSVFGVLREKTFDSIETLADAFYECVKEQATLDITQGVNDVVETSKSSDPEKLSKLKELLFNKYNSVFQLDLTEFNLLSNPDKAIEKMYNLSALNPLEIADAFEKAVAETKKEEQVATFILNLPSQTDTTIEGYLSNNSSILDIDLQNEDYTAGKAEVLGDILSKRNEISSVDMLKTVFYESVLLNSINAVPLGNRDEIGRLLGDTYKDYWTQPENFKNASDDTKKELYKKINGMTHESLSAMSETIRTTIVDLTSTPNPSYPSSPSYQGGGISSSSSSKTNSFKADSTVAVVTPTPTEVKKAHSFTDISDVSWAKEAIEALYEKEIINGKSETEFKPNDSISREEFAKILAVAFEIKEEGENISFADVSADDWSYLYIKALYNAKIINGQTENIFGKTLNLSRADFAVLLKRISSYKNIEMKKYEGDKFADDSKIPDYAKDAVYEMKAMGIIDGMGENTYAPENYVTRAQAAKVVYLLMSLTKGE